MEILVNRKKAQIFLFDLKTLEFEFCHFVNLVMFIYSSW